MLLSVLLENFNDDLISVARQLNLDPQVFHNQLKQIDPTQKHGNYILKLIESKNIRWPEDASRVEDALKVFSKVKSRLPIGSRDINKFKTILELEDVIEPLVNTSSKRQGGLGFDPVSLPGIEVIKTVGRHRVIRVSDPESLKKLGEGTKWCTRGSYSDCQADDYLYEFGELFVLIDGDVPIVQWTPDFSQVMDRNDEELRDRELCQLIGYEEFALGDASVAFSYARDVIKGRWIEAESVILTDAVAAFSYARYMIKGRWPEAESVILTDAGVACDYARNVIKGRWPEAEPTIMTSIYAIYSYACYVIKGRWLEAEPTIMKNSWTAHGYALNAIKSRWPEAEPVIAKNSDAAFSYARCVIKGRWPLVEPMIMMNIDVAYAYVRDVIKGRWPEAELMILSSQYAKQYKKLVDNSSRLCVS